MEIVLNDGTKIECTINGNNYITTQDVSKVNFTDANFVSITVDGVKLENQKCSNVFKQDDGTHIIFRAMTPEEIGIREIQDALVELAGMMEG